MVNGDCVVYSMLIINHLFLFKSLLLIKRSFISYQPLIFRSCLKKR